MARLSWEPFDPEKVGYEALSRWLTEFYRVPPWHEYLKCFACGGRDDFGPAGTYGRVEVEARGLSRCPSCDGLLELFWSSERIKEHLRQLGSKGRFMGFTVLSGERPAAWLWGYEIRPESPAPWGRQLEGRGLYGDRIVVLPAYRDGLVLWYLILVVLTELRRNGYQYVLARTHIEAENVRILMQRLGFQEIAECPLLPQRSYWLRSLSEAVPSVTGRAS